jgi:hypothetical protein
MILALSPNYSKHNDEPTLTAIYTIQNPQYKHAYNGPNSQVRTHRIRSLGMTELDLGDLGMRLTKNG